MCNDDFDMIAYMQYQCDEIRRHKWIESEKACRDLGKEAEMDWIQCYAARFRKWAMESGLFAKSSLSNSAKNNNIN